MRLCLLVLITLFASGQQSQPPSPTPGKTANSQKEKSASKKSETSANDEATQKLTSAITQLAAEVAKRNQEQANNPNGSPSAIDWWARFNTVAVTVFTGALALLACLQWRAAHRQANISDRQAGISDKQLEIAAEQLTITKAHEVEIAGAKQTADERYVQQLRLANENAIAAKQSADAAQTSADSLSKMVAMIADVEGAVLGIEDVQILDLHLPYFTYRVGNTGRTNGAIFYETSQMLISETATQPPDFSIYNSGQSNTIATEFVVVPPSAGLRHHNQNAVFGGYFPDRRAMTEDEISAIRSGEKSLWACSVFRYRDRFEREWERRSCQRWEPAGRHFCIAGPPEFNRLTPYKKPSAE